MSHSDTESHKCNSHDRDCIADLTKDDLAEIVLDQAAVIDELSERVDQLESKVQDNTDQIDQEQQRRSAEIEGCHNRISEVENTVEETNINQENPTPEGPTTTLQPNELTPIEQLSQADDVSEVTDSPTVERAVSLFKNLSEWGSRTPKGIVLKPADNPLKLLEADRDESLAWKQYYRAAEALEQLSQGSVTFFDSDRHGKMICLHEQSEAFDRVANGGLTPSSVEAST